MADPGFPDRGLDLVALAAVKSSVEPCGLCGGASHSFRHRFTAPPPGETDFGLPNYRRELWRCDNCGHVVNRHAMDLERIYSGAYATATYGDRRRQVFDRIMALPLDRSDNRHRVAEILAYAGEHTGALPRTLFDVGSGLAVFGAAMRAAGWQCAGIDPDPAAVRHANDVAGMTAICGDFMTASISGRFTLVTLNKVIEHVPNMVEMLARAAGLAAAGGIVYVEVPDGEAALSAGPEREEFFVEHHCAFSLTSLSLLAVRAGCRADLVRRLREPSGKFTLRAFLAPTASR